MNRRTWLRDSFLTLAGSTFLLPESQGALLENAKSIADGLSSVPNEEAYWQLVKKQFPLQEGLYYFNNASLGPSPDLVINATEGFRKTLEAFPSKYMWSAWKSEKEKVRDKAAALFRVSSEEIALIHNTTEGINLVASSLDLQPGDEVILSDHEHPSGTIPWQYWQERKGIKLVRPVLPLVPESKEQILEVYRKAITPRTKAISMVHITNTNGMILPVKEVSEMAHEQDILVAVDGAQSAGMLDFNLNELGCDFYAGSSHKWLFSPKGMGIFYARQESQKHLKALIVAHGYDDPSIRRLENYNTRNLPELLGLGVALDFHQLIGPGRKQDRIYALKHYFVNEIKKHPSLQLWTPEADDLSAGIVNVEVKGKEVRKLKEQLFESHQIDCRPMYTHGLNGLRISLSVFNTKADIDYLINALV